MSINSIYLSPFSSTDITSQKWRMCIKVSGTETIFSTCLLFQLTTDALPPITTTTNYMTIYHAGTDAGAGLGIFLKYSSGSYYLGVRYILKPNGSIWTEIPESFVKLSDYSSNINVDSFLVMLSYDITSSTSPFITFSLVNFSNGTKIQPDFTLNKTLTGHINSDKQWGFGCSPESNTAQYGLITTDGYNSYSASGIYLGYLESWTNYLNATSVAPNTYAFFNTSASYSVYDVMKSNGYFPDNTANLIFQLFIPDSNINNICNNVTNPDTLVTLTTSITGYSNTPHFGIDNSTNPSTGSSYIYPVVNGISCILIGMKVLTVDGYKNVEQLTINDKLLNSKNEVINIINIHNFYVYPNEETIPLIIKKNCFGAIEDLYISKLHKVFVNNKFICSHSLNLSKMNIESNQPINYFHIETTDYLNDDIIVNGVVVESYTPDSELSQQKFNV
jgi:hypothetical protein